ncbi:hypothetical protein RHMOL_Rhmol08G0321300 [Rhododendron molle]|uniref:Uncharacterized protein n=1 Tax=Rhododendron molle TaxID=49168 RepID=A0ACC0MW02_RHOML|nr:hypothetical protein RHMOL_Rhmol08G0321300 [Rhododendron molle]
MDRESSSDEEEDRRNLINQNERPPTKSPTKRSTFQIDDGDDDDDNEFKLRNGTTDNATRHLSLPKFSFNKRYLLAIFLPLFIVVVYFTADITTMFQTSISGIKLDSSIDRMRESELHALYLLRQQQLGLLSLWNNSFGTPVNSTSNSSGSPALFEDFKSAMVKQISLNKQIQQVLLSSHEFGSSYWDLEENVTGSSLGGYASLDRCRKVDQKLSERKTIEWKPRSDKYLFAICVSGQMSNHLICLEKHMFFAVLLNRVLVIPSSKVDYEFNRVLDIDHINKCLGRKVVVTFEEFSEAKKKHLHIDKFVCYFSLPQLCFMDDERVKKLKSLGVSMNKLEPAWVEDVKKPTKRTMQDVVAKFSSNDDVIAIGDVFFADMEQDLVMQPGGPIAHQCKTLIEPSRLIMLTAQSNAKQPSCFFPIPQAADCIGRVAERANTPVIYLSTDAAESETRLLQSLVVSNGKAVPLVKRPARNSAEKWDALLYRHGLEADPQVLLDCTIGGSFDVKFSGELETVEKSNLLVVGGLVASSMLQVEAMLDKTICAMSTVFIGASGSTFTEDILRLRKDWGSASLCDEYLCQDAKRCCLLDTLQWLRIYRSFSSFAFDFIPLMEIKLMNRAWTGLEKAPPGSFKNKLYGLGLRLLARVKPSEIFLKSISKEVTKVEVTFPSSLSPRLVRRRLRHIAQRGTIIHKRYFYGSVSLLPLTTAFTVLPLPNIPFFWVLFRSYSHWRALKVLQPSKELEELIQRGDIHGGLSECLISTICKTYDLNKIDVLKYQDSI